MWPETYEESRQRFRDEAGARGARLEAIEVVDELTIDVALFGDGPRAVCLSSGLHGVEGFAGAAIQRQVLAEGWPDDVRLVLIHALNPYGMANGRRFNENNVDLNRNWLAAGEDYSGSSDGYRRFNELLNPQTPQVGLDPFLLRAAWNILRFGMPAMKQAVVSGQYDFPKGLFWGGDRLQPGPSLLLEALPGWFEGVQRIVHVDFHTGLGEPGTYALLVECAADSEEYRRFRETFGDRVQPWAPGQGVAYSIRGGMPDAVARLLGDRVQVLTCEFGTVSALKVISALRAENRATHWGGDVAAARRRVVEVFRPSSPAWRQAILDGGRTVVSQAFAAASS